MDRYLKQYYIAENSLTGVNGTIFGCEKDFFGELDTWELVYENHSVYDFVEQDCSASELKQENVSHIHVTSL